MMEKNKNYGETINCIQMTGKSMNGSQKGVGQRRIIKGHYVSLENGGEMSKVLSIYCVKEKKRFMVLLLEREVCIFGLLIISRLLIQSPIINFYQFGHPVTKKIADVVLLLT